MSDPRIDTELGGYRIEALIGRGGMGVVYRAEDLRLGRKVALKLLTPDLAENEGFRERFESESRLAAAIDHPHIIPLYEAGDAEGLLFLTMRYVDGIDLKALLERDAPLALQQALAIVAQVGGALDAAHARGLVHRDVKPANVLVDSTTGMDVAFHCYLTDFGLTKDTSQNKGLTGTGQFVGTIAYVAPEQIEGTTQGPATDQYALGCVLYECLTGHPPFERPTELDVMWAHLGEDPPLVSELRPDLPPGLDGVLTRALSKAPEDRHASCSAMVAAARETIASPAPAAPTEVAGTVVSPQPGRATTVAGHAPAADGDPAPAAEPAARRGRARLLATAVALAIVAAVAGAVAGASGDKAQSAAANVAATGGMSLRFPAAWETVSSPPAIPGLKLEDRIALGPRASAGREGLVAGRIASPGARLLPAELVRPRGQAAATRDAVRLGEVDAFRYAGLRPAGFSGAVSVYVLLTDRGRSAIACYAAVPSPSFDMRCANVAASLELTEARALALAPSSQYAKATSDLLAGVSRDRAAGRLRLRAAKTSVGQTTAARALAASHANAMRRARGLPAPPAARDANAAIAAALRDVGRAYSAAAAAARRRQRPRYRAANRTVRRAEQALRTAVGALADLGYDVQP